MSKVLLLAELDHYFRELRKIIDQEGGTISCVKTILNTTYAWIRIIYPKLENLVDKYLHICIIMHNINKSDYH